jgi:hypothetical protein
MPTADSRGWDRVCFSHLRWDWAYFNSSMMHSSVTEPYHEVGQSQQHERPDHSERRIGARRSRGA